MSHKSYYSYLILFKNLGILFENVGINFTFDKSNIMTDFERGLRKALKNLYPNSNLEGCYFHYTKALLNKGKNMAW